MSNDLILINSIIALLLSYIAFGEKLTKILKWLRNKSTHFYDAKEIIKLILQWFEVIDNNEVELSEKEMKRLQKIEEEISFQFQRDGIDRKMIIRSSRRFRNKYLSFCGLKKSVRTIDNYIKYVHIKNVNFDVALELISSSHHTKYTKINMPLSFYWTIIRSNYYIWVNQYRKNWEGIELNQKVIYTDIKMPMKALRLYYNI
jgi:hypothetical protein